VAGIRLDWYFNSSVLLDLMLFDVRRQKKRENAV
jgi:hypothetical protein